LQRPADPFSVHAAISAQLSAATTHKAGWNPRICDQTFLVESLPFPTFAILYFGQIYFDILFSL
jgi:hypothetical protein